MSAKLIAKIMRRTLVEGDCLIWQGAVDSTGYSSIWDGERVRLGHRLAYELLIGPIPDGMTIDHLCFMRACLNPEHLRPLSVEENARRQRRALATHCDKGHPYTPENTRITPIGRRRCRACDRARPSKNRKREASA